MKIDDFLARLCMAAAELPPIQFKIFTELLLYRESTEERFLFRTVADWGHTLGYSEATARRELREILKTKFVRGVNLEGGGVVPGYFVNDFVIQVKKKLVEPQMNGFILYLYIYKKKKEENLYLDTVDENDSATAKSLSNSDKKSSKHVKSLDQQTSLKSVKKSKGIMKSLEKMTSEEKRQSKQYLFEFKLNSVMLQVKSEFNRKIFVGNLFCQVWPEDGDLTTRTKIAILKAFKDEPMADYWFDLFQRLESITDGFSAALSFHRVIAEHRKWKAYPIREKKKLLF